MLPVCRYQRISGMFDVGFLMFDLKQNQTSNFKPQTSPEPRPESISGFGSGDNSAVAPPVPIPNTEVKRCSPDGSATIGCARVGRRQNKSPAGLSQRGFCVGVAYSSREWSRRETSDIDVSPKGERVGTSESIGRRQNQAPGM